MMNDKIKQSLVVLISFILLFGCLTACAPENIVATIEPSSFQIYTAQSGGTLTQAQIDAINQEETYPPIQAEFTLERDVKNMSGLIERSDIIAEVKIVDAEAQAIGEVYIKTYCSAEIISVFKGNVKPGNTIDILEEGGTHPENGTFTDGIPASKGGEHYIYFLEEKLKNTDENLTAEEQVIMKKRDMEIVYFEAGLYQGRFVVREGYAFQQSIPQFKFADYQPVKATEFTSDVAAIVKEQAAQ